MAPLRLPSAVGRNVTEIVQVLAAGTSDPQVFVWPKSPVVLMEEIESAALPILRTRTVCAVLVAPTAAEANCRAAGVGENAGAEFGPILSTKASLLPPDKFWTVGTVTGKSVESVEPAT